MLKVSIKCLISVQHSLNIELLQIQSRRKLDKWGVKTKYIGCAFVCMNYFFPPKSSKSFDNLIASSR